MNQLEKLEHVEAGKPDAFFWKMLSKWSYINRLLRKTLTQSHIHTLVAETAVKGSTCLLGELSVLTYPKAPMWGAVSCPRTR